VGTKRFNLALQSEGRKSVEEDWRFISQFSDFKEGFKAIANIAAVAGWGVWKLISIDKKKKRCIYRVWNSWEGLYQKTLGVCWGSGMLAGKMAGYCTKLFKTNCWAKQTAFITEGDQYDEFSVVPSDRSLENEIENLLTTDEATRADMAVALKKLQDEILERKRAEEGLKVSEEKYRAIFESFQDVYYQNDTQGRLTEISPSVRQYGYEPDEILGCFAADFYNNPSDFEAVNEKLKENGVLKDCEIHLKHRHGKMIDASLTARMVYDKESRWIGTEGVLRDITERKRAENITRIQKDLAVKLSETSFLEEALIYCVDAAIQAYRMDSAGIYLVDEVTGEVNLVYSTGFNPDYVKSVSHYDADSPNAQIIRNGASVHVLHAELDIPLSETEISEGLRSVSVIPVTHKGNSIGCMNIASHSLDITSEFDRKSMETIANLVGDVITRIRAEQKLRESEERYRRLFEDDLKGDYISTPDGTFITCNNAFAKIFGFSSAEEVISTPVESFYPDRKEREDFLRLLRDEKKLELYEKDYRHRDGHILHIIENAVGIFNTSNELIQVNGFIIDNTERKNLEKQLMQSQKEAENFILRPVKKYWTGSLQSYTRR